MYRTYCTLVCFYWQSNKGMREDDSTGECRDKAPRVLQQFFLSSWTGMPRLPQATLINMYCTASLGNREARGQLWKKFSFPFPVCMRVLADTPVEWLLFSEQMRVKCLRSRTLWQDALLLMDSIYCWGQTVDRIISSTTRPEAGLIDVWSSGDEGSVSVDTAHFLLDLEGCSSPTDVKCE